MRRQVEEHNVYRWAANFLTDLAGTRSVQPRPAEVRVDGGSQNQHGSHVKSEAPVRG
jgi:hypothetical protein